MLLGVCYFADKRYLQLRLMVLEAKYVAVLVDILSKL
jgi:hypothetical protein